MVVIMGDFNCFVGQKDESASCGTLLQIVDFLSRFNIFSLYHKQTDEAGERGYLPLAFL